MAYFDERQSKIILTDQEEKTFKECQVYMATPPEKRPKPELYKWLENMINN
jgi:hypothetical protein